MVSVINTVDTAHEDMIHDAQMDYYGTKLATCSSDKSVKVFDVKNGQQTLIANLKGHDGPVWQLAWSHPKYGSLLASVGYDRKLIIWSEQNGAWQNIYEYKGHDSSINSVCWAPHEFGAMLVCGSSDEAVSIISYNGTEWTSVKKNNVHTSGVNAVSWGPAILPGSLIDGTGERKLVKRFVSGGCDNLVKIWKEENGDWVVEQKLEGHSNWVRDVAWAPSIGLPTSMIASCSQDQRVIIWKNDGKEDTWTPTELNVFNDAVWHLSWSVTGSILAVSGADNKVSLWKETLEGKWVCISDVNKGQGQVSNQAES